MANSSSESHHWNYDVFLSFRGEDTSKNFVDHLNTALVQKGIRSFKDDDEEDPRAASEAIEESRCAIVIFSKSYASSSKCLDELVKIMECNKDIGQLTLPIFYYDFNPSNLRRQGLLFGKLFSNYNIEKVRAWSSALVEAANLSGRTLIDYRYKATDIQKIVEIILGKFGLNRLKIHHNLTAAKHDNFGVVSSNYDNPIGIERRVQEVKALLQVETGKIAGKPEFASSPPLSSRWTYDVVLSFRGNDICQDFVEQLYRALDEKEIYTFSDNRRLGSDKSSASQLLQAIEESSMVVVILSKNYAASSQCLDELVKVMSHNEENGQVVFPVFYDVDPSDVRNQKRFFGEAFMQYKPEKVETWRKALAKASSLAGWYLIKTPKSHEAPIIISIVDAIQED